MLEWRTVWRFLKKVKIELPYDPTVSLLDMYLEKTILQKDNVRTRWRSRWTCSTSLSVDTSGIHLQTQKCMHNTR